jgi:hypothetical protein
MLASAVLAVGLAVGATVQKDGLRVSILGQVQPYKLPRTGTAPIAVFISGHVEAVDGSVPPQLQRMEVLVNRHGVLDGAGLPTCTLAKVRTASTGRALSLCADALVGSGRFWATIVLPDQRPYPTRGRLLVFNGRRLGRPVIFAHIYTTKPFATSFVVTFAVSRVRKGIWGTRLSASLPQALGDWGFVDRIKLTLRRKYRRHGQQRSYFAASCPAPDGARVAPFRLARASFDFSDGRQLALTLAKSCGVKG